MIQSFRDRKTEKLFHRQFSKILPTDIQHIARRKLLLLDAAISLEDLRVPPGNRLEALKGTRQGQYSIRINSQWRICFTWQAGNAHNVEITDYH